MCFPDEVTKCAQSGKLPIRKVVGEREKPIAPPLRITTKCSARRFVWSIDRTLTRSDFFVLCARREVDASTLPSDDLCHELDAAAPAIDLLVDIDLRCGRCAYETFESRALTLARSQCRRTLLSVPDLEAHPLRRWVGNRAHPGLPSPLLPQPKTAHKGHRRTARGVGACHCSGPKPCDNGGLLSVGKRGLRIQVANASFRLFTHPLTVEANIFGETLSTSPRLGPLEASS